MSSKTPYDVDNTGAVDDDDDDDVDNVVSARASDLRFRKLVS
jgi:hypothetical protein